MLGQAKTVSQAEIDAACELIDFWRFNVHFASQVLATQPVTHSTGVWNRTDHRPLEGFVYAVTPFNFTAILLQAAGLPPGVINLVNGSGHAVSEAALADPGLGGVHFTGSTRVFHMLWKGVAENLDAYQSYLRIVGETGGKDFILAHTSADPQVLWTAMVRGAFEYQGQKCSAASRAYVPRSLWRRIRKDLVEVTEAITMGPTTDFSNLTSAVIDDRAFAKHKAAIDRAHATSGLTVHAGGSYDDSVGYYVRPTIVESADAGDEMMSTEYFGPILTVHVYPDSRFEKVMDLLDETSSYGLTGSIIADDRTAIAAATSRLRYAAGNFYINDKPTGAVVGQQPFGGARGSGTNDKAGAAQNLMRWTSTRESGEAARHPDTRLTPDEETPVLFERALRVHHSVPAGPGFLGPG